MIKRYITNKKEETFEVLLDDEDTILFDTINWYVYKCGLRQALYRVGTRDKNTKKTIYLHRKIMNAPIGMEVDHINGNALDNRKCNLRVCTSSENSFNMRGTASGTSKYKGVSYDSKNRKWIAQIVCKDKKVWGGRFITEEEAAIAYNKLAKELFGQFARLNVILDKEKI